jgi:predicted TIM-barrel fold metal-dependent hydrolase
MHIHIWKDGDPDDLMAKFEKAGVYGGAVFSRPPAQIKLGDFGDGEKRLSHVLNFTRKYPDRLFPVLWIHPDEKNILSHKKTAAAQGIKGFKIICNDFYVYENKSMEVLSCIAELGIPICFHSGILWTPGVSGDFNRPVNWEKLIEIPGIRFSMAHCSWPWYDECIALYGKFLYLSNNQGFTGEMYFDLTPGTPPSYRRDLLTKIFTTGYDVEHNVMFGVDSSADDYSVEWAHQWINTDNGIYDELGISAEVRDRIYSGNMLKFFGISGEKHRYMAVNYDGR